MDFLRIRPVFGLVIKGAIDPVEQDPYQLRANEYQDPHPPVHVLDTLPFCNELHRRDGSVKKQRTHRLCSL